jgi:McbB family protein
MSIPPYIYCTDFVTSQAPDGAWYLYLADGVRRLEGEQLAALLPLVSRRAGTVIRDHQWVADLGAADASIVYSFLHDNGVVRSAAPLFHQATSVALLGDTPAVYRDFGAWLRSTTDLHVHEALTPDELATPCDVVIGYRDSYSDPWMRDVLAMAQHTSHALLTAYRLDRFLYIDNWHFPAIDNPHHLHAIEDLRRKSLLEPDGQRSLFHLFHQYLAGDITGNCAIALPAPEYAGIGLRLFHKWQQLSGMGIRDLPIVDEINRIECHDFATGLTHHRCARHHVLVHAIH